MLPWAGHSCQQQRHFLRGCCIVLVMAVLSPLVAVARSDPSASAMDDHESLSKMSSSQWSLGAPFLLLCVAGASVAAWMSMSFETKATNEATANAKRTKKAKGKSKVVPSGNGTLAHSDENESRPTTLSAIRHDIEVSLEVAEEEVSRLLGIKQRCSDGTPHPAWLEARRNRLTASRFAAACGAPGARSTPALVVGELLKQPEGSTRQAGRFGVVHEDTARRVYCSMRKRSVSGGSTSFEVKECGFCVSREEPWLGASPDGVCFESGRASGVLEIKTAKVWNDLMASAFSGDVPAEWFYQMQGTMWLASQAFATMVLWCDLFLWTPERSECRRIDFDAAFWNEQMLPTMRSFYFGRFLPVASERILAVRRQKELAAKKRKQRKGK
eukprot:TRINITY_DN38265_c0_g1_i1.p1 TRINITY_DN38265_c0_g1~~TRINITY_DN38265_c0_g1_i1.p1  ORF type:complete len:385 (+),score=87.31 TRINITY_DN38265_c0_g1_i1:72-1226(+)